MQMIVKMETLAVIAFIVFIGFVVFTSAVSVAFIIVMRWMVGVEK